MESITKETIKIRAAQEAYCFARRQAATSVAFWKLWENRRLMVESCTLVPTKELRRKR